MENFKEILIVIGTIGGSAGIWKFLEARIKLNAEARQAQATNNDGVLFRDDLKERVRKLENMLAAGAEEKDELRNQVLELTAEVHALRVKVEYLEKENEILKSR